jgi:hypothetical protein
MKTINGKEIKFNDINYNKSLGLYVVSFFVGKNCYDYFVDIEAKEVIMDYTEYCRYNGEESYIQQSFEFKTKLTKLNYVEVFDKNELIELDKNGQEIASEMINDYLEAFPDVYHEATYN